MEKFNENLTGAIRRFAMAGVGAVSLTIEKSKEIVDQLAARGEATAADGQTACSELQKKMTEQLNAFTQKLKEDCEAAGFEQLVQKCRKLTPEQKALLIERITAEPEPEETSAPEAEESAPEAASEAVAAEDPEPLAECESAPEAEAGPVVGEASESPSDESGE